MIARRVCAATRPLWVSLLGVVVALGAIVVLPDDPAEAAPVSATLAVTDGYDAKNAKTLVQDGKVYQLLTSDNDRYSVEAGSWLSVRFQGAVPADATITSVALDVEHYEESGFAPGMLRWEVGGGPITAPTMTTSTVPSLLFVEAAEATGRFVLTGAITTPAGVNGLVLVVRNSDPGGKKTLLDRVSLVVSYDTAPSTTTTTIPPPSTTTTVPPPSTTTTVPPPSTTTTTITPPPPPPGPATTAALSVTDGYDSKNAKTLVADGKLYQVLTSDNDRFQVTAGHFLSMQFGQVSFPAGSSVQSTRIRIEHHEETSFPAGSLRIEAGGGSLSSPSVSVSTNPAVLIGPSGEATFEWDVTSAIDTPAEVNGLRFVVRNNATNGKLALVDRVQVVVMYTTVPVAPTITSSPGTAGTVNQAYAYQAQASGTTPITWSLPGAPAGMTVNASSGLVTWTPPAIGSFPVTLRATNTQGSADQTFTVVVIAQPAAVTVLAAGDVADCGSSGDEATELLLDANPHDRILALGDLAYENGTMTEFNSCYHPSWGQHLAKTSPAPGNHEYNSGGADYYTYFGAAAGPAGLGYYSFDLGAWHIVSLNSEVAHTATSAQMTWLRNDLTANTRRCVLAYWHRPRFTAGNYNDFTDTQPFWDALSTADAEIVLSGHDHNYQRYQPMNAAGTAADPAGIRSFVVGTGGRGHYAIRADSDRQAGNDTAFGVLKLTLGATDYSWQFIPVAGQTFTDSGTGTCT